MPRSSGSHFLRAFLVVLTIVPAVLPQGGTWTAPLATMPTPRSHPAAGAVNGLIYAIGGSSAASLTTVNERYDPATNTWTTGLAPLPTARTLTGTNGAVVNGRIYVIGGNANGQCSSANQAYDPATNSWASLASMPTARCHLAVVALNGLIYAIGGTLTSGAFNFTTVERYDPSTNTWATVAPMNVPRSGPGAAVINGKIYVVGGFDPPASLNSIEEYDPAAGPMGPQGLPMGAWTFRTPMPTARSNPAIGALNGVLYAIGGSNGPTLGSVEAFFPASNYWAPVASIPTPRSGSQAVTVGCSLYMIGGGNASSVIGVVEAFSPNALVITAPTGSGSLRVDNFFCAPGTAGTLYITAATVNAPAGFPTGPFFGLTISPAALLSLIAFGPPFIGQLSPTGTSTYTFPAGIPPGVLLNAVTVAFSPVNLAVTGTSLPIPFLTP